MEFERKVSGRFVERVFAGVDAGLVDQLLGAGLDVRAPGMNVSIERFARGLSLLSREKFPGVSQGEGLRRLGRETVTKAPTKAGRTLPEAMEVFPAALAQLAPFVEPKVHARDERHYVAHLDDVASLHTFFLGLLEGVTSSTHGNVRVTWAPAGLSGARYDVRVG